MNNKKTVNGVQWQKLSGMSVIFIKNRRAWKLNSGRSN